MAPGEDFLPEVCKIKHDVIDNNFAEIKKNISEIKEEEHDQHEEIKNMISKLSRDVILSHTNLKNKIVLINKSMGDKIDELNRFDKTLRGNGDPGVWESVRSNRELIKANRKIGYWFIGVFSAILIILIILTLGGSWNGVSKKTIGEESQRIKRVEITPKEVEQVSPLPEPLKIIESKE